jgi:PAS domain S-box-containing protein
MKQLIRKAAGKLRNYPALITLLGIGYELALGLVDYSTPEEMSFTIFYLFGVAFVGWGSGTRAAVIVSAVSAAIMAWHEQTTSGRQPFGPLLGVWNASTRFLLFCAAGWLTAEITRLNRHLHKLVEARTVQLRAETQKHKATSAQLSEALSRLRTIIASVPMMIFAVDRKGIITFEDGRALKSLGVEPGEHVGKSVLEAYGQCQELPDHVKRALQGEEFSATVEIGPVVLDSWYSPARDEHGGVCGYTGVAFNVTERRRLEHQILEISDREQARIGQEIHDGLCQQLVSLAFDANSLENALSAREWPEARTAQRIAEYLDQAITESRQLARGLFPIRLEAQGLPSALEELARATQARFQTKCRFVLNGAAAIGSKTVATHLYRIAQEAVTNAVKHSKAQSITLRLQARSGQVELNVEDDGRGFDPVSLKEGGGMGLHIMAYRARTIGGRFSCGRVEQGGTMISCCVPGPID